MISGVSSNNQIPISHVVPADSTRASTVKTSSQYSVILDYVKVNNNNPEITQEEVNKRIESGQKIAQSLLVNVDQAQQKPSHQECRDLCWFLTASAFKQEGEPFARGIIRLTNHNSEQIYNFIKNADDSYTRPSSHFKEMTVGSQIGHDFSKGELHDAVLGTLLCAKLDDGSVMVKFERQGLNWRKPGSALEHMKNWASHEISGGGAKSINGLATRRETDGQEKVAAAFEKVLAAVVANHKKILTKEELKELTAASRTFQRFEGVQLIKGKLANLNAKEIPERLPSLQRRSSESEVKRSGLSQRGMINQKPSPQKRLTSLSDSQIAGQQKSQASLVPLDKALGAFDEAISTVKQPDKISGNEVLLELNFNNLED